MLSLFNYNNADASIVKLLKHLDINIAHAQVEAELEKHPDYPSLLAISDVLTNFNVENTAFRVDFDELDNEMCPFLAHTKTSGNEFVVVKRIDYKKVTLSGQEWRKNKLNTEEKKKNKTDKKQTAEPNTKPSDSSLVATFAGPFVITG